MEEVEIHRCLISHGFYPMTLVLKELESVNRFEDCSYIYKAMISFKEKYNLFDYAVPTRWSEEFEKFYFNYFSAANKELVESNLQYYIKDIKERLRL